MAGVASETKVCDTVNLKTQAKLYPSEAKLCKMPAGGGECRCRAFGSSAAARAVGNKVHAQYNSDASDCGVYGQCV